MPHVQQLLTLLGWPKVVRHVMAGKNCRNLSILSEWERYPSVPSYSYVDEPGGHHPLALSVLQSVASLGMTMPSTTEPSKRTANTDSSPVEPLNTGQAGAHSYVYPVALLSTFYFSFPALVLDPISTLAWALPPLVVSQIGHSITCLPSALSASTGALATPGKADRPRKWNADKGSTFASQFVVR